VKRRSANGRKAAALADPITLEICWNRLVGVVNEQAAALQRTSFTSIVREAGDLSAGVFDLEGRMLAQAVTGTPGHVNAMAESVAHFIRDIGPDNIFEGDVYITNDPYYGGVAPRVGFAWTMNEQTVIRGGYGIVYRGTLHDSTMIAVKNLLNNR